MIISGHYNSLQIWDVVTGNIIKTLFGHTGGVCSLCYSSDGKRIVSGSWDKTIKIWDA
jgi:WD40 repeat protein